MNKKMKILVIVSLMMNVLLIGTLIGVEGKRFMRFEENNHHFFKEMKKFRKEHKAENRVLNKERQRAVEMLVYGPYDEMEYKVLIDKINIIQGKVFKEMSLEMARLLKEMPPEEKEKILKHLRKRFGHNQKK